MYGAPFDWEEQMRLINRQLSAAGGVPPMEQPAAAPTPLDEIPETTPEEPESPSQAQRTAKEVFGIGSTGPMADRQNQAVDDYNAQQQGYYNKTGQMAPQQFGSIEGTFLDSGLKKPKDAVEEFMATKTPKEIAYYSKLQANPKIVTPQQQLEKNRLYEEKVAKDRLRRDEERDRLRGQGYANRAATADKQAMAWQQMLGYNALQGAGPGPMGGGGPYARDVGGAILVGPGMGEPSYGYGRGGRYGASPEQLAIREAELAERIRKNQANEGLVGQKIDLGRQGMEVKQQGLKDAMDRFKIVNGQKVERSFEEKRRIFDQLMADYDRRSRAMLEAGVAGQDKIAAADAGPSERDPRDPSKTIPGLPYPGSFNAIKRRIYALGTDLAKQHDGESRNFAVDPATIERWNQIKAWIDAEQMATPQP